MSDEHAEKRFDATPSRRERAKREGNTARSHELASIASFGGALLGLTAVLPLLSAAAPAAIRTSTAPHLLALAALSFVPAACAALAGTALALAQSGGLHVGAITLDLGKLAPLPGLKRMLGMQAAVAAVRAGAAFVIVLMAVAPAGIRTVAAAGASTSPAAAAAIAFGGVVQACFAAAGIGALFALADYAVVRRRWLQSLKMTFEEFRRDAKEQDGDPHAKSRRKQLHRTLVRGGIGRTGDASFVVVNPTHIAIALRYAPPQVPVPEILVRAAGAAAHDVRALAERAGIPVLENVALARLLWRCGEAGRPIPPESFVAVATAIAALIRAGVLTA